MYPSIITANNRFTVSTKVHNGVIDRTVIYYQIAVNWIVHVTSYKVFCWFIHCKWLAAINTHTQSRADACVSCIDNPDRKYRRFTVTCLHFKVSGCSVTGFPVELLSKFIPSFFIGKNASSHKILNYRRSWSRWRGVADTFYISCRYQVKFWKQ